MIRCSALALAVVLGSGAAWAQNWQANSFDTGALIHGAAIHPGTMALSCTAPSPGGRQLIETGDHEATRTDTPYDLVVSFHVDFLDPFGRDSFQISPTMTVDGTRFALPDLVYEDFFGAWTGWTRFDAPGILELFDAQQVILDTGTGVTAELGTDGLAQALNAGLSPCLQRWLDLGHPLPPRLAAHVNRNAPSDAAAPTTAPGETPHQAFPVPQTPPEVITRYLFETCQGPFSGDTADIGSADFDGDGLGDYVLDWNDLTCNGAVGPRPNCGAANCLIDVFLSSRNYADPEGILAIGFTMTTLPDGRPGIVTGGTAAVCHFEDCDAPWVFDGQGFQR